MKIRLLNASDAEQYWFLRLHALKENPTAFATSYEEALQRENPIKQTATRLSSQEEYTFGAFDEDEQLVGVVTLFLEKQMKHRHRSNILAMYVVPLKTGMGIGMALMKAAINQAKALPVIEKINLSVVSNNYSARSLYLKCGFKIFGYEERALVVDGQYYDEELMVLMLK